MIDSIHLIHERLLPFHGSFACHFPSIQIAGVCLTYQPIDYDSVFSDFNTTTCKHLEGGPTESLETIKVTIDSSCIPNVQLYVSVQRILLPIVFKKNMLFTRYPEIKRFLDTACEVQIASNKILDKKKSTHWDSNIKNEGILIFIQVELEVLLRHREDCYSQELIFVDHNKTVCNTRTRCQGKTLREKEDSSVCLVNNLCACVRGCVCVREREISSIIV